MKRLSEFLTGLRGARRRVLVRIGDKTFDSQPGPHEARMIAEAAEKRVNRRQQGWQPRVQQTWRPVEEIYFQPRGATSPISVFVRTPRGFLVRAISKKLAR